MASTSHHTNVGRLARPQDVAHRPPICPDPVQAVCGDAGALPRRTPDSDPSEDTQLGGLTQPHREGSPGALPAGQDSFCRPEIRVIGPASTLAKTCRHREDRRRCQGDSGARSPFILLTPSLCTCWTVRPARWLLGGYWGLLAGPGQNGGPPGLAHGAPHCLPPREPETFPLWHFIGCRLQDKGRDSRSPGQEGRGVRWDSGRPQV